MTKPVSSKPRRPMGSGSIVIRPTATGEVRYEARIPLAPVTGPDGKVRRPQLGKTFSSNRAAKAWLTEQLSDKDKGTLTRDHQLTLGDWLTRWIKDKEADLRPKTLRGYTDLLAYVPEDLRRMKIRDVRPHHLDSLFIGMRSPSPERKRPIGPATVRGLHRVLRSALSSAERNEYVSKNVAKLVDPKNLAMSRTERPVWEASQVRAFLNATACDRLAPLWALLLTTGVRRGEALGLRWEDVELIDVDDEGYGHARIVQAVTSVGGKATRGEPKTTNGTRVVGLAPEVVKALKAWRKVQAAEQLAAGIAWGNDPEIFLNSVGRVTDPDLVSKRFRTLATQVSKATGQPVIRLHDTRHTVATQLLDANVKINDVSRHMGHATLATTVDLYGHRLVDSHQAMARAMVARLG